MSKDEGAKERIEIVLTEGVTVTFLLRITDALAPIYAIN